MPPQVTHFQFLHVRILGALYSLQGALGGFFDLKRLIFCNESTKIRFFLDKNRGNLYLFKHILLKYLFYVFVSFTIRMKIPEKRSIEFLHEPLAQSVEQQPFKLWVVGSSPTRLTILYRFLSSSPVQDVALSRQKQGFKSP